MLKLKFLTIFQSEIALKIYGLMIEFGRSDMGTLIEGGIGIS